MTVVEEPRTRAADVYRRAVVKELAFLKRTRSIADLHARGIPLAGDRGLLVPVCDLHDGDARLVSLFARWRAATQDAFPTRFEVTEEGTARWLRAGVLDVDDRILFLVLDRQGHPVGHLGFANGLSGDGSLEVDNVVRGEPGEAGLMTAAMEALLGWAEHVLAPERIVLRVLGGNARAIRFYERLGFVEEAREPLRLVEAPGRVELLSTEGEADDWFVRMRWAPERPCDGSETILTAGPSISGREASYALDAARDGWNGRWNGYLTRFERDFAEYVGARHAIATSSCTGALHMALLALGIGPGDEVIVPELTWVATASAVAYTGATPVFADVQPDTWCVDPASVEALVGPRTRAIVPVHLYGHPADMDAILALASEHGLAIVEDAAPAIGAEVRGRRVGALGDAGGFSFQGAKLLVAGEGGMFVTDSDEVYERARVLALHGCSVPKDFWVTELGLKYRMANVQAAIGLGQLERVDELIEAKRRIFDWYAEELEGLEGVTLGREAPWARSICWMTSVQVDAELHGPRERLRERLAERGVDTRPVFPPISGYPIWGSRRPPQPVAARVGAEALNLPSGVRLRREQVAYVCEALKASLRA